MPKSEICECGHPKSKHTFPPSENDRLKAYPAVTYCETENKEESMDQKRMVYCACPRFTPRKP